MFKAQYNNARIYGTYLSLFYMNKGNDKVVFVNSGKCISLKCFSTH